MNLVEKVFGTHSDRELKLIYPIVKKIESLRPEMASKSDEELRDQTRIFKERLAQGETLDELNIKNPVYLVKRDSVRE